MKIYINDIPVILIGLDRLEDQSRYDMIIDGSKQRINHKELLDDVLVLNASADKVDELLHLMTDFKFKDVDSITFASSDNKALKKYIKTKFKLVEAAGGVVDKGGKLLLIYRQKRWDLPKGKLDKGEDKANCALREVEEETGVKAVLVGKIGHTWHTYMFNKRYVIKKTHWYAMKCVDDTRMAPQMDEDIEQVRWMTLTEMRAALYDSYRSIRVVVQEYHKFLKEQLVITDHKEENV